VGGVVRGMDEERASGMRRLVRRLADQGVLRADLGVEDAEQMLWALTSFETFDALYTGRRLSTTKTVALLVAMAERALYAQPDWTRG
jgi:hypothetical protein